jgi:outer membrane receptor protein involved in Fe transport
MYTRTTIITFLLLLGVFSSLKAIEGQVRNANGEGIQNVYVLNISNDTHAHTGPNGLFRLSGVEIGDTLLFRHLGFERLEYLIQAEDQKQQLQVILQEMDFQLNQVVVSNELKALNVLTDIDLSTNPVNNSQELLQNLPGLFIGQHAGGGKAEQIFLRGFDIDHGTDLNISVDGLPINMVSHAHGQGYSDLHFIIPETIENIDFDKGPYSADKGNFATAGYVDFKLKDRLDGSSAGMEYGQFNTLRTTALIDLTGNNKDHQAYVAGAYTLTDGPFDSPQGFHRLNLMGKYTARLNDLDKISLMASHFNSRWDASGQIPVRAVESGLIGRFGAIDDTEGGQTSRTNILLEHTRFVDQQTSWRNRFFYSKYEFELYSNFTFFLNNPELGDQIRQFENRDLFGLESVLSKQVFLGSKELFVQAGGGLRYDRVADNELSRTLNRRTTLENLALGQVDESNVYGFVSAELNMGPFLINPGLRVDYFNFGYTSDLDSLYTADFVSDAFVSPKLNISYNPNAHWQFFAKAGMGFHSNDSRVVVARNGSQTLPGAFGADVGAVWKPTDALIINTALWHLFLEQEFVYVGDEAIVEPSGRTRRMGVDFGLRYQATRWLFFNSDLTYTYARSIDDPEGVNLIPLAPDFTATGGISVKHPSGLAGGLRFRYLDDRPANEDNSIVADGYFVTDFNVNYSFDKITVGVDIQNLFNTDWNETQFATESRLRNEPEPVEEIHFTPGVPFFAKARIAVKF